MLGEIIKRVKKVASHIKKTLPCDGFNILQNNGEAAGQSVHHIHFHIIPRMNGDELAFHNSPGDMAELDKLAKKLAIKN